MGFSQSVRFFLALDKHLGLVVTRGLLVRPCARARKPAWPKPTSLRDSVISSVLRRSVSADGSPSNFRPPRGLRLIGRNQVGAYDGSGAQLVRPAHHHLIALF